MLILSEQTKWEYQFIIINFGTKIGNILLKNMLLCKYAKLEKGKKYGKKQNKKS